MSHMGAIRASLPPMQELLKSNDLVLISYVMHLLAENGIEAVVFDEHMSAVEGSIGALPRRVMVENDEFERSKELLGKDALTKSG
jgi:Putative prokaryotic signal transducing protein